MTENLPAVVEQSTALELRQDTDSWTEVVGEVAKLASYIAETEFVPKALRGKPAAAAAAMLYGREIGLPPMTSLNMTNVIDGRPGVNAEAMRMLVLAAGHEVEFVESTGAVCIMRGRRIGGSGSWTSVRWDIDMARAANLTHKDNWKNYPRAMLQARATTELCRMIFPDVIHGFRSTEELADMGDGTADAATPTEPAAGRTRVTRKRAASKVAQALPSPEERTERPQDTTPAVPLPGEAGYDETPGEGPSSGSVPPVEPSTVPPPDPDAGGGDGRSDDPDPVSAGPEAGPEDPPPPAPKKASRAQHRMIFAELNGLIDDDRDERLLVIGKLAGRPLDSMNELTDPEASAVIDTLARIKTRAELSALLDEIDAQERLNAADAES